MAFLFLTLSLSACGTSPSAPASGPGVSPTVPAAADPDQGKTLSATALSVVAGQSSVVLSQPNLSFSGGRTLRVSNLPAGVTAFVDTAQKMVTLSVDPLLATAGTFSVTLQYVAADGSVLLSTQVPLTVSLSPAKTDADLSQTLPTLALNLTGAQTQYTVPLSFLSFSNGRTIRVLNLPDFVSYTVDAASKLLTVQLDPARVRAGHYTVTLQYVEGNTVLLSQTATVSVTLPAAPAPAPSPAPSTYVVAVILPRLNGSAPLTVTDAAGKQVGTYILSTGELVTGLANGTYTFTPGAVSGYVTPAPQTVTVNGANAAVSFAYTPVPVQAPTPETYSVTVNFSGLSGAAPVTVTDATGKQVGSYALANGGTVSGLVSGSYTFAPGAVSGYVTPAAQTVTVNGANTSVSFAYAAAAPAPTTELPYTLTVRSSDAVIVPKVDLFIRSYQIGTVPRKYVYPGAGGYVIAAGEPKAIIYGDGWTSEYITVKDRALQATPIWQPVVPNN